MFLRDLQGWKEKLSARNKTPDGGRPEMQAETPPEIRERYGKRIESEIEEWSARLAELKAKAGEKRQEIRKKYGEQLDALEDKLREVNNRLSQLVDSTEEAREGMKARLEETIEDIRDRFKRLLG